LELLLGGSFDAENDTKPGIARLMFGQAESSRRFPACHLTDGRTLDGTGSASTPVIILAALSRSSNE
jgi:hypothetical protein